MHNNKPGFFCISPKNWPLSRKILFNMVAIFLLLSFSEILINRMILRGALRIEFQRKGLSIARSIAANSVVNVLTQNTPHLKQLLDNERKLDKDITYVFIIDSSGRILSHTFNKGFPIDLAGVNNLEKGKDYNIRTLDTQLGFIYDIAVPVFYEKSLLGQVHLGILQKNIQQTIDRISIVFIGAAFLIILAGVFLSYRVSYLITEPISKLVEAVQSIQHGNLSAFVNIKGQDEIGLLASAFNEMALRLSRMIEKIKRLSVFEERNRIALDLHDGFAQDFANIIKRLELCEKLFKIQPVRAIEELGVLKESTRDLLNRTREIIFDLKSPEEDNYSFREKLTAYARDFQKASGIKVKLDISASLEDIPFGRARSIFYIISEAFTNADRHSHAGNIELNLRPGGTNNLRINVKDDGRGFDTSAKEESVLRNGKFGLTGMQRRAVSLGGTLFINSVLNQGTEISVIIPIKEKDNKDKEG